MSTIIGPERHRRTRSWLGVLLGIALLPLTVRPASAQSGALPNEGLRLEGQIGGATYAAAWDGRTFVMGQGPRILVVETTADAPPRVIGRSEILPGVVDELALGEGFALVGLREGPGTPGGALEAGSTHLVDLRDPRHPRRVAEIVPSDQRIHAATESAWGPSTPYGGGTAVVGGGHTAAIATRDGVRVFDLRNPGQPIELPMLPLAGDFNGMAVDGDQLYVLASRSRIRADGARWLLRLDGATPGAALRVIMRADVHGGVDRLVGIHDGQLVVVWQDRAVVLYDVRYRRAVQSSAGGFATYDGQWDGTSAFFSDPRDGVIRRITLFEEGWRPEAPLRLPAGAQLGQLALHGRHLVAGGGSVGALGWLVGQGQARGALQVDHGLGYVTDVAAGGRFAFAASTAGLGIVDLRAPGGLRLVDRRATSGAALAVDAAGLRVLVADHHTSDQPIPGGPPPTYASFHAVDVASTGAAREIGVVRRANGLAPRDVAVEGDRGTAILASGTVLELDLGDTPRLVGTQSTTVPLYSVARRRGELLVAYRLRDATEAGAWAFRAEHGGAVPAGRRFAAPDTRVPAAAFAGPYVLFGDGADLYTLDLRQGDPTAFLGRVALPPALPPSGFAARWLSVPGSEDVLRNEIGIHARMGRAWVAHGIAGIYGVDVRLPALPEVFASFDTPGHARRIVEAGDRVLVADGDAGLLVLRWEGARRERARLWLPQVDR